MRRQRSKHLEVMLNLGSLILVHGHRTHTGTRAGLYSVRKGQADLMGEALAVVGALRVEIYLASWPRSGKEYLLERACIHERYI